MSRQCYRLWSISITIAVRPGHAVLADTRISTQAQDIPYEVFAVDNGSTQPLSDAEVRSFGPEFRYRFVPTQSVSPVEAVNAACREATGEQLLVMIDGAHIVTPRVFHFMREAFRRFPSPFVATVPFYLGPTKQNLSVQAGYNQQVEDRLLQSCGVEGEWLSVVLDIRVLRRRKWRLVWTIVRELLLRDAQSRLSGNGWVRRRIPVARRRG